MLNCGNCPYYTGIECHGHGDFWGSCRLKALEKNYKYGYWGYDCICYDETICKYTNDKKKYNHIINTIKYFSKKEVK